MDRALIVSQKNLRWLSSVMLIAMSFALSACQSDTLETHGLLLAFESKTSASSVGSIRVMQSNPAANAMWSATTPWVNASYPGSDVPKGGVGIASNGNRGRLIGWSTNTSAARTRSGDGVRWDASARDRGITDSLAFRSAPSIARHGASSWLIAERVKQQSQLLVYWPEEARYQEQKLGDAAFSGFSRNHPVVAISKDRFLLADVLLGGEVNAKLQIVTGNVTRSGVANPRRFTPVYCVPPRCPVVIPLVTDDWVNEDDEVMQFIATDVALADDIRGGFLMAVLETRAKLDPTTKQLLPIKGGSITLKVLQSSNQSFNRGDGYSVWSDIATQVGLQGDAAQFVQVALMPGSTNDILVLTVGPAGKTGWKIVADASRTQALTETEISAMFGGVEPASQPFALISTSRFAD